jgi:hypothetical protein
MRAVVEVAQFHDLPIKETAKVLDISVAAAKGRFFHARAKLRKSLELRAIKPLRTEPRNGFAPVVKTGYAIPGKGEPKWVFPRRPDCSDPNRLQPES